MDRSACSCSYSAGGTSPSDSCRRALLNQPRYSTTALEQLLGVLPRSRHDSGESPLPRTASWKRGLRRNRPGSMRAEKDGVRVSAAPGGEDGLLAVRSVVLSIGCRVTWTVVSFRGSCRCR